MTLQVQDIFTYKNETYSVYGEPLECYLKTITLPHPLVAPSSACWRGYTAQWAIDNKKLFLIKWEGYILDYLEVDIKYLFPNQEIVFANWFSGSIHIALGDVACVIHNGHVPVFEGRMILQFENGILVSEQTEWLSENQIAQMIKEEDDRPF
ncbi:MAG TPA: hypothetical protein PLC27_13535 [Saprospiraceae bacterium]|nr:hypothetical protein [Saprospiraceae bacterium]